MPSILDSLVAQGDRTGVLFPPLNFSMILPGALAPLVRLRARVPPTDDASPTSSVLVAQHCVAEQACTAQVTRTRPISRSSTRSTCAASCAPFARSFVPRAAPRSPRCRRRTQVPLARGLPPRHALVGAGAWTRHFPRPGRRQQGPDSRGRRGARQRGPRKGAWCVGASPLATVSLFNAQVQSLTCLSALADERNLPSASELPSTSLSLLAAAHCLRRPPSLRILPRPRSRAYLRGPHSVLTSSALPRSPPPRQQGAAPPLDPRCAPPLRDRLDARGCPRRVPCILAARGRLGPGEAGQVKEGKGEGRRPPGRSAGHSRFCLRLERAQEHSRSSPVFAQEPTLTQVRNRSSSPASRSTRSPTTHSMHRPGSSARRYEQSITLDTEYMLTNNGRGPRSTAPRRPPPLRRSPRPRPGLSTGGPPTRGRRGCAILPAKLAAEVKGSK